MRGLLVLGLLLAAAGAADAYGFTYDGRVSVGHGGGGGGGGGEDCLDGGGADVCLGVDVSTDPERPGATVTYRISCILDGKLPI